MTERTPEQIAEHRERMRKVREAGKAKREQHKKTEAERLQELEREKKEREEEARWAGDANLGGITVNTCPTDCNIDRCVITGVNVCAHPSFGGPQAAHRLNPEVMKRFEAAKKIIAHQKIEATR